MHRCTFFFFFDGQLGCRGSENDVKGLSFDEKALASAQSTLSAMARYISSREAFLMKIIADLLYFCLTSSRPPPASRLPSPTTRASRYLGPECPCLGLITASHLRQAIGSIGNITACHLLPLCTARQRGGAFFGEMPLPPTGACRRTGDSSRWRETTNK